jgi:hypothetical protein
MGTPFGLPALTILRAVYCLEAAEGSHNIWRFLRKSRVSLDVAGLLGVTIEPAQCGHYIRVVIDLVPDLKELENSR